MLLIETGPSYLRNTVVYIFKKDESLFSKFNTAS